MSADLLSNSNPTYPSRPKMNSTTSIISSDIIAHNFPPWIQCFFNTIQSVNPIIICINSLFLYVLSFPTRALVTKSEILLGIIAFSYNTVVKHDIYFISIC